MTAHGSPAGANSAHAGADRKLIIGALGVVFGDIGTSPLYAFRECLDPHHGIAPSADNILGLLSLIVWSMTLVISVKYVAIIMRADNRGEGGVLALSTLLLGVTRNWKLWGPIGGLGLFGAALFFGDGFITPPVSILGAIEGVAVAAPGLNHFIVPLTIIILISLFIAQRRGTGAIGKAFGPVMLVWFTTLALLGLRWIIVNPQVLFALNPWYAIKFIGSNGPAGFVVLSSVFLAVTGGEALYADMGHFGRRPIRMGWFTITFPALVLNYFGQGAVMLHTPAAIQSPFYYLAPSWALPPLILLATMAAIIASQAVISGVFTVTRQALNLGYLPRLRVLHSSREEIAQVYVPTVNWLLCIGTLLLVVTYGSSTALAGAYGIAISSTMLIDAVLVILLLRFSRAKNWRFTTAILAVIAILDILFVASNSLKFAAGGWLPITVAAVVYLLMTTWHEGRRTLNWVIAKEQMPVRDFLALIDKDPPLRVPGTAVYLAAEAGGMPRALLNNLKFNRVLHERNILLTFVRPEIPFVPPEERVEIQNFGPGLCRIIARYGFMESPNVVAALRVAEEKGVPYEPEQTVYVVGRENPVFAIGSGMPLWRKRLFALMGRNSQLAAIHFGVPSHRLLEVSSQVKL
ncbi:MAG TPA: potassium transporter Kup [Steroidobacteraceae bacterium]|nr:potassium transporter Kup [Steroidobacteraceae bacterium]